MGFDGKVCQKRLHTVITFNLDLDVTKMDILFHLVYKYSGLLNKECHLDHEAI